MSCVAWNCPNKPGNKPNLSFFKFPRDPELRKQWKTFCQPNMKINFNYPIVCMEHFKNEDIEGNLGIQLGFRSKRVLKPGAVPCINKYLHSGEEVKEVNRLKNRKIENEFLNEIETTHFTVGDNRTNVQTPLSLNNCSTEVYSVPDKRLVSREKDEEHWKTKVSQLEEELLKLKDEKLKIETTLQHLKPKHLYDLNTLKRRLRNAQRDNKHLKQKLIDIVDR